MKITFFGAAGEVTGSQHLIETDSRRILLDCGLFQGRDEETGPKNRVFHCKPRSLDAVILSHAHIDHCGNLPGLVKAGFEGSIYCTRATADIATMMLRDSAKIQREDAIYKAKKAKPGEPILEPLYTEENAREVAKMFEYIAFNEWEELADDVRIRFLHAGHILGSAITELEIKDKGEWRRIVFTGDLGRRGKPLLHDPECVERCDVVISESTYGNRVHPETGDVKGALQRIICDASRKQGKVIIPAFSLGRTQLLVYLLNELRNEDAMCRVPVYIDSPLATRLTEIYRDHQEGLDEEVQETLKIDDDIFSFDGLTYVRSRDESIALNRQKGPFVVISASGMCENGRVVHHLKNAVSDPNNTIMIIGFQARGTLGRQLVQQRDHVYIFGRRRELNANVETVNGLSAHADAEDFKWWFNELQKKGGCGHAFLVHGEEKPAAAMAELINDCCDHPPVIPQFGESFEV
ncbi:MBL fold metallo-hydrolase [Fuerstiella marisgermanici]|uniref:Ribonuclease n=1 Tax=Fuerstiella marisgermanici TaxID=1891926 RepID=A0A1P8WCI3_9PLAN|nr:MBL fold metallo-hydrolase [Fuerstiella marisgermanici]APZ91775.1 Ribonuclease [Fuerstiella marisgermanici]